jgi:hypothetical protein
MSTFGLAIRNRINEPMVVHMRVVLRGVLTVVPKKAKNSVLLCDDHGSQFLFKISTNRL